MKRKNWVVSITLLLVLSILITGCSGGKQAATEQSKESGQQKALQIATFVSAFSPIHDWDPAICFDEESKVFFNTYETLLLADPDTGTYKPVLATSYSKSDDGLVWTFKLRQGVKFHDGTDFNAEAVKFSIERNKNMKKAASYILDSLKEVKVTDDYTVQFILSKPAPIDAIVSCAYNAYIYSPASVPADYEKGTEWFSQGKDAGTGPYMIQSHVQESEVVLTKFDDYWGGWEGNHFDKVVFKQVAENASRRQLIESGEVDTASRLEAQDLKALEANPNVQVVVSDSYMSLYLFLNTQKAPLNNILVRQALAYTFPYQQLIDYLKFGKYASVATDTLLPSRMWGSTDSIPYTYDLDKAKALLAEAGYSNGGLKLTVTLNGGMEDRKKAMQLWKSELSKIGVDLNIQGLTYDGQMSMAKNANPNERQDIVCYGWWPDLISPMSYYEPFVKSGSSFNFSYYSNKEVDTELDAANVMSGVDMSKATEMFKSIGQKLTDECIAINICDEKSIMVINKNFKGFKPNISYQDVIFVHDTYREE